MLFFNLLAVWLTALTSGVFANRQLTATSLVSCMKDSKIDPHYFNVVFDADKKSIKYDISLTTELSGYIYAKISVYVFGINAIQENMNFCSSGWKQFCPIYPGSLEIESVQYIDESYVKMIPGAGFTFPDLDATVRVVVYDADGNNIGCLQAAFTNGKTVSHIGAKWATAVVAGIGLLLSGFLSLFGNSASAARMSAMAAALFTYFQAVIIMSMLHVQKIPPIAGAWSENLAWTMGLIRVGFMQKIFRWYVQATGGTPTQYLTSTSTETSVLAQKKRSWDPTGLFSEAARKAVGVAGSVFETATGGTGATGGMDGLPQLDSGHSTAFEIQNLAKRKTITFKESKNLVDVDNVSGSSYLTLLRGIKRVGYKANIEPTSIVSTGFAFFVVFLYVLVAFWLLFRLISVKSKKHHFGERKLDLNYSWGATFKGILLRYIYIGFPQLITLSLWEFIEHDSAAVVVIAVFLLLLALSTMGYACWKVIGFGRQSVQSHNNAAVVLYGEDDVLKKYGFLYTILDAPKYYFCAIILGYVLIKCIFVGLGQGSGKVQAMCIFLLDLAYTIYMGIKKPYLDKPTNIMNILINSVITVNSFFFTFFSGIYGAPSAVASIMGLVYFILNAAFSLILLLYVLFFACVVLFSKNPDAKFSPAKDDRMSFKKKHQSLYTSPDGAEELMDLGNVARGHDANWASEMYKLRDMNGESSNSSSGAVLKDDDDHADTHSIGDKVKSTLTRGKSMLSRTGSKMLGKKSATKSPAKSPAKSTTTNTSPVRQQQQQQQQTQGPDISVGDTSEDPLTQPPQMAQHNRMESMGSTSVNGSLYNDATTPAKYNYL